MQEINKFIVESCSKCGARRKRVNGYWLKARREAAELQQDDFAKRVSRHPSLISMIESNKREATPELVAIYESL